MPGTTMRVSRETRAMLRDLAANEQRSMQAVLETAVEEYRRLRLLEQINADYAALRQDAAAWVELEAERAVWDSTLADGLDSSELWPDEGDVARSHAEVTRA